MIQEGDLVHIPQGVEMWSETPKGMKMKTTRKPITGVYLSGNRILCRIYAAGNWEMRTKHVYPLGGAHAIG